jgi:DNA polymerase-3 subunit alpha
LAQKYCAKETAKQYSEIDNIGLVTELANRIDNKALSVVEQVKFEQEYLNYVIYTNPKVHESYWIVTEYKTFKESRKPYVTLHNVRTGTDIKTKITSVKIYEKQPFGLYSVLKVNEFTTQFKKKNVNGEWVVSDTETEEILTDYEVIK